MNISSAGASTGQAMLVVKGHHSCGLMLWMRAPGVCKARWPTCVLRCVLQEACRTFTLPGMVSPTWLCYTTVTGSFYAML
jgi:hypothetical protein